MRHTDKYLKACKIMRLDAAENVPHQLIYTLMGQRRWVWDTDTQKWVREDNPQPVQVAAVRISGNEEQVIRLMDLIAPYLKMCGFDARLQGPFPNRDDEEIRVYLNIFQSPE